MLERLELLQLRSTWIGGILQRLSVSTLLSLSLSLSFLASSPGRFPSLARRLCSLPGGLLALLWMLLRMWGPILTVLVLAPIRHVGCLPCLLNLLSLLTVLFHPVHVGPVHDRLPWLMACSAVSSSAFSELAALHAFPRLVLGGLHGAGQNSKKT